ncbi:cupin [Longispora fulva]|uniref:Putative cupin superfamily sugar epimerase n=1 Tax=Longispora fulva TaxID=619741 RepID=A0A8J7GBS0_9ACTN|nr:cupin domain-containing protein [Longispora fulva]MBG6137583.1 putative cupin superfamily sugar epimerase [Longispora fulva]GIG61062.1 cupin [Longispora fulva]
MIEQLRLEPHPEGGWYRRTWTSPVTFDPPGYDGERPTATCIHYLLRSGEESVWHTVRSDELWLWHLGGPLLLRTGGTGEKPGEETEIVLGPDLEAGQVLQAVVPGGTWQAARPLWDKEVLLTCFVTPGFDMADFRMNTA